MVSTCTEIIQAINSGVLMEASNIFYGVLWCPMPSLRSSLSILKPRCMEVVGISPILFYMGLLRSPLTSGDFCLFVALCNYLVIYLILGFTGADMNLVSYILCHHPLGKIITLLVCITFFIEYDSRTAQSFFPTLCCWATPPHHWIGVKWTIESDLLEVHW